MKSESSFQVQPRAYPLIGYILAHSRCEIQHIFTARFLGAFLYLLILSVGKRPIWNGDRPIPNHLAVLTYFLVFKYIESLKGKVS